MEKAQAGAEELELGREKRQMAHASWRRHGQAGRVERRIFGERREREGERHAVFGQSGGILVPWRSLGRSDQSLPYF